VTAESFDSFAAALRFSGLLRSKLKQLRGRKEKVCVVGEESKGKKGVFSTEYLRVSKLLYLLRHHYFKLTLEISGTVIAWNVLTKATEKSS